MRRKLTIILALIMILSMAVLMPSCGGNDQEEPETEGTEAVDNAEGEESEVEAKTVVKTIEDIDVEGENIVINYSVGYVHQVADHEHELRDMISDADELMYEDKRDGMHKTTNAHA